MAHPRAADADVLMARAWRIGAPLRQWRGQRPMAQVNALISHTSQSNSRHPQRHSAPLLRHSRAIQRAIPQRAMARRMAHALAQMAHRPDSGRSGRRPASPARPVGVPPGVDHERVEIPGTGEIGPTAGEHAPGDIGTQRAVGLELGFAEPLVARRLMREFAVGGGVADDVGRFATVKAGLDVNQRALGGLLRGACHR